MRRKPLITLAALLTALLASGAGRLGAQDDGLHWFDNYRKAIEEAKRTQKPIFLEFRCEA